MREESKVWDEIRQCLKTLVEYADEERLIRYEMLDEIKEQGRRSALRSKRAIQVSALGATVTTVALFLAVVVATEPEMPSALPTIFMWVIGAALGLLWLLVTRLEPDLFD